LQPTDEALTGFNCYRKTKELFRPLENCACLSRTSRKVAPKMSGDQIIVNELLRPRRQRRRDGGEASYVIILSAMPARD
jgi:hypothetical protein